MIRRVEGIIAVNAQVRGNDGRTRATGSTSVGRVSSHVTFVSCFGSISGCCSFFFFLIWCGHTLRWVYGG